MKDSAYLVKTIENLAELQAVYAFAVSVLGAIEDSVHTLAYYQGQLRQTPTLLVTAERQGKVIGCILASIDQDHVLIGPTAVADTERGLGVGLAMMRRVEEEARKLGQTSLILGSRQAAEGFYLRCGFLPNLFIQSPGAGRLEQLKQLNVAYPVVWENQAGEWTRLMLATRLVDRELQSAYAKQFPDCHTQYVFIKEIGLNPTQEG